MLPTLTVTDDQSARILAAFGTVAAYKEWLRNQIISFVQQLESSELYQQYETSQKQLVSEIKTDLS